MNQLFDAEQKIPPMMVRCDCKFRTRKGVKTKRPKQDQPMVLLVPGIDPNYVVGVCKNCDKKIIERVTPIEKRKK